MSDKKRHGHPQDEHDSASRQQWQREREQVLAEYGTWRSSDDERADVATEVQTLETLLRLKAEQQGSPEPGVWREEQTTALLTEVVPRTVIQPREQVMDLVPTLKQFFAYLRATGRWDPDSMRPQEAPTLLGSLEFATLEAADDPSRRSFSTNILGYGLAQGVDLEDDAELAIYMNWYNSLPDEERLELSETGRLANPSTPFDPDTAPRESPAAGVSTSAWPWFLPAPDEDIGNPLAGTDPGQEREAFAANSFVQRAVAVLEFVGDGRRVTGTDALGRADSAALLEQMGIERGVRSMWDHPELAGPWIALLDGGWLEIGAGWVRRETGPVRFVPASEDPDGFVEFGHAVLTATLFGKDARDGADGGFMGMPDTIAALLVACGPGGLTLHDALSEEPDAPEVPQDPSTGEWDRDELRRLFAVAHDLSDLAAMGVLERDGNRYSGSSAVMVALIELIKEHGPGESESR
ncbi:MULTISPECIES: hypothetical protein [unclassified Brachybacterium]|uniref:hypothetical protein n=1 Tax=unclassified Brachybacterium TaxID=2623841 RepID=UPI003618C9B9